jgi:hypothetical protein
MTPGGLLGLEVQLLVGGILISSSGIHRFLDVFAVWRYVQVTRIGQLVHNNEEVSEGVHKLDQYIADRYLLKFQLNFTRLCSLTRQT